MEPLENRALLATTLIAEDFSVGAANFTVIDGRWSVGAEAYRVVIADHFTTDHLNIRSVHDTPVTGDFTLDVDAKAAGAREPWANFSVIFGYQDHSNYYFFSSNQSNDASTSGLFKVVNGVSTELADVPQPITPASTYQVRLERQGDQIRAYRDGTLLATASDSTFLSGRVGVGTSEYRGVFDNFVVTTPDALVAPSSLTASAVSSNRIDLSWADNSTDETGFKIEQSTNGVDFTQVATVNAGVTAYVATDLNANTPYSFRVRAYNAAGDSAYSNAASATTPVATPAAPSALVAVAASSSLVNLSWLDNSTNEAGFKLERSTNGSTWVQVGTVGPDVRSFAATGLTPSTTYQFRVRAYNSAGDSAYSSTATATTQAVSNPPLINEDFTSAPAAFTAVDGHWALANGAYAVTADNNFPTTHLDSRSVHDTVVAGNFVLEVDATALAARDPWANFSAIFGYQDASNYYFFSSNQSNDAATSGLFKVVNGVSTELADVAQGITPGVTYRLRLERAGSEIRAYRDGAPVASAADGTFASGRVGLGTRQFQAAFDNLVVSGASAQPSPAPAAPSAMTASAASSSRIDLTWSDNSANESGFKIERSMNGTNYTQVATVGAGVTGYAATGLGADTSYYFRVRAYNSGGDSGYSNTASARTLAAPPAAPSGLAAAAASSSQVNLSWSDNSSDETGFKVERSTNGTTWTQVGTVGANVKTYLATDLTASTQYWFRVRAYNAAGDSGYSNTASAATQATPSPVLIAEDFSAGAANFAVVDGPWGVSGGAYRVTADNTASTTHLNSRSVHGTIVAGDFTLTVDAQALAAAAPWANFSVIFSYQDPSNYYFFSSNQSNDAATSGIFRVVNGVSTELADVATGITVGTVYQLRLERQGDQIRAYRDGALVASASDSTFTSGRVGLGARQFQAVFDNLAVDGSPVPVPTAPPAAPSGLATAAASSSQINLSWSDNSGDESGFKVERSTNGTTWTQVATVGANVRTYAATGLSASTAYFFRVRATNAAGDSAYSNAASATTQPAPAGGVLPAVPQSAVDAAAAVMLIRYDRDLPGGAHTQGAFFGGASVTLAAAAYAGNASADARLLEQARYTLTGGNDITANGGYPAQHERHVTGMFAIMKATPRVWNQLTAAERHKADLLMTAALVAGAFTTGDANPYIASGQAERTLDGDTNLSRDWNPNYREGMVGSVLVGAAYFGPAQAQALLSGYDHASFVAELAAAGLSNLHETFTWKAAHPESIAPDAATVQAAVRAPYRYYGLPLTDVMGIYGRLLADTYGAAVNAGLNGGAGIDGAGRIVSGAETLPNPGAAGMLKEFDSVDAGGPRSAANYAFDGYRPHLTNVLTLIASGLWQKDSPAAREAAAKLEVGNTDLWYKLDRGYIAYYKGENHGTMSTANAGAEWGFAYNRPLWEQVLRPYLQATATAPTAPAAPSGLAAAAASSSRIDLTWADNSGNETGFKVERSTNGITWTQVATVAADVRSYAATGLSASTAYQFRVRATNAAGDSAYSNTASATTQASQGTTIAGGWELTAPDAPAGPGRTGPSNPSALAGLRQTSGTWVISAPGTYGNVEHTGEVVIAADNVVLENFVLRNGRVDFSNRRGVTVRNFVVYGGWNETFRGSGADARTCWVEHGALYAPGDSPLVYRFSARYLYLEDVVGDCFSPHGSDGGTIEYCYVNRVGVPASGEKHADGWHSFGTSNMTVRYNKFVAGTHQGVNSAVNFDVSNSNNLIEYNYFDGGGYAVYHAGGGTSTFRHNRFGRTTGLGPVYPVGWGSVTWLDNAYLDGQVINRP